MAYIATVQLLLDVPTDGDAADAVSAILTEHLRHHMPTSCLVDWRYVTGRDGDPCYAVSVASLPADFSEDSDWPSPIS